MNEFSQRVIELVANIPHGQVTTYGLIATAAGNHCGARQVARILHSSSDKYKLPWHRVVNIKGNISPRRSMSHLEQQQLLVEEKIMVVKGRVNLDDYLWIPQER